MVNRFLRVLATSGLVVAGLAFQQSSAHAAFMVSGSTGGSAFANENYANLDGRTVGSTTSTANGLTIVGGTIVNGSSPGLFAAPLVSGTNNTFFGSPNPTTPTLDTTNYLSTGIGSAVLTFATTTPVTYFGLLWGSIDSYNTISFTDATGAITTFSGTTISSIVATPLGQTAYVNFVSSAAITSVTLSSPQASFEVDNVAFGAVPEPSSLALCGIAGVLGLGVARKRAKRVVA